MVNFCRYCLTICDENVPKIKQVIRDITKDVLPELDLTITEEPVICNQCEEVLRKCFNFKSTYFSAIDSVLKSVDTDNTVLGTLDLKEIYMKIHNISDIDLVNNHVCRLCFELVTDEFFISLTEVDEHVLNNCMSLMTLNLTLDPVICISCHNSLRCYSSFIDKCMETEEKIKKLNKEFSIKEEIVSENNLASCSREWETDLANKQLKQEDMTGLLDGSKVTVETEPQTDELIIESDIVYPKTEDVKDICEDLDQEDESELKLDPTEREELPIYRCKTCCFKTKSKNSYDVHIAKGHAKKYSCEYCTFSAVYRSQIKRHMLTHEDRSKATLYKCRDCDYETIWKEYLKKHESKHKDRSKFVKYKCEGCDYETIEKGNLKRHELTHRDPSEAILYKCRDCNFQSIWKESLRQHELTHRDPSELPKYKCQYCTYEFFQKANLKKHELIHKDPAEVKLYKCRDCDFKSIWKRSLQNHQLKHKDPSELTKYKCQSCDYESIQKGALQKHIKKKHKGPSEKTRYKCPDCNFEALRNSSLRTHMNVHQNNSAKCKYSSSIDGGVETEGKIEKPNKEFSIKEEIVPENNLASCSNESETNLPDRNVKREDINGLSRDSEVNVKIELPTNELLIESDTVFLKMEDVRENQEDIHKDINQREDLPLYRCKKCGYKTKSKDRYDAHSVKCLAGRCRSEMYGCEYCTFTAVHRSKVETHMLTHKDRSELTLYKCRDCDFDSIWKGALKTHELSHKDPSELKKYKCKSCDYETVYKGNLPKHALKHENSSQSAKYKCQFCNYKSIYEGNLKRHELRHKDPAEVTKFKCHCCTLEFNHKKNLKRHVSSIHENKLTKYKCHDCDFESTHKESIKRHVLKHKNPSELTKFKCRDCDYESIHRDTLRKHELKHKDPSEVTKHKCHDCNSEFRGENNLKRHVILVHKNDSK